MDNALIKVTVSTNQEIHSFVRALSSEYDGHIISEYETKEIVDSENNLVRLDLIHYDCYPPKVNNHNDNCDRFTIIESYEIDQQIILQLVYRLFKFNLNLGNLKWIGLRKPHST